MVNDNIAGYSFENKASANELVDFWLKFSSIFGVFRGSLLLSSRFLHQSYECSPSYCLRVSPGTLLPTVLVCLLEHWTLEHFVLENSQRTLPICFTADLKLV